MATKIAASSCCCYYSCVSAPLSLFLTLSRSQCSHSEQKLTDVQLVGQPSTSYAAFADDHQIKQLMAYSTGIMQRWAFCQISFAKYQKRTFTLFDRRHVFFFCGFNVLCSHSLCSWAGPVCVCVCVWISHRIWLAFCRTWHHCTWPAPAAALSLSFALWLSVDAHVLCVGATSCV